MPRAVSRQTWSKWGVSPRITQPRAMIASTSPRFASRRAAVGISKAPGTHTRSTRSRDTPCASSASRHPSTRCLVTNSLNRPATTATRRPRPSTEPRKTRGLARAGIEAGLYAIASGELERLARGHRGVRELLADPDEVLLPAEEGLHDLGIEVLPRLRDDHLARRLVGEGHLVRPFRRERVVDVGQRHDARAERDLLAPQGPVLAADVDGGIARAVPLLVVVVGDHLADREDALAVDHLAGHVQRVGADDRVLLHLLELVRRQLVGLLEDVVADPDLPEVVQRREVVDQLHVLLRDHLLEPGDLAHLLAEDAGVVLDPLDVPARVVVDRLRQVRDREDRGALRVLDLARPGDDRLLEGVGVVLLQLLDHDLVRDVAQRHLETDVDAVVAERVAGHLGGPLLSPAGGDVDPLRADLESLRALLDRREDRADVALPDDLRHVDAVQLAPAVTEQGEGRPVGPGEVARGVERHDGIGGVLDDGPVPLLAARFRARLPGTGLEKAGEPRRHRLHRGGHAV